MAALPIDVMWKVYGSILNQPEDAVMHLLMPVCTRFMSGSCFVYKQRLFICSIYMADEADKNAFGRWCIQVAVCKPRFSSPNNLAICYVAVDYTHSTTVPQWYYTCSIWLLIILKQCNEVSIGLTLVHTLYRWPTVSRMVSARTNRLPSEYDTLSIVNCGLMVAIQKLWIPKFGNWKLP